METSDPDVLRLSGGYTVKTPFLLASERSYPQQPKIVEDISRRYWNEFRISLTEPGGLEKLLSLEPILEKRYLDSKEEKFLFYEIYLSMKDGQANNILSDDELVINKLEVKKFLHNRGISNYQPLWGQVIELLGSCKGSREQLLKQLADLFNFAFVSSSESIIPLELRVTT